MRTVKKEWIENFIPHQDKISYEQALNELQEIFTNCTKEMISKKLNQGTKLGNGRGTVYQVLVIKKKGGE